MISHEQQEWQRIAEQSLGEYPETFREAVGHLRPSGVNEEDVVLRIGQKKLTENEEDALVRCQAADVYAANPDGTLDY
jgi:hypothetical protein